MTTARKLWLGFGLLTTLIVLLGVLTVVRILSIGADAELQANVSRARNVATRELEADVGGYALAVWTFHRTKAPSFRDEADGKASRVRSRLAEYERLAETGYQRDLAARFSRVWGEFEAGWQLLLDPAAGPPPPTTEERLTALRLGVVRLLDEEMQPDAEASFAARRDATLRNIRGALTLTLTLTAVGLAVAVAAGVVVGRGVLRAERRLRASREELQVTLASIGDAVVTTDAGGRVRMLNAVAESLTGWPAAEARGRPLEEVFRIVNEDTRLPVETPVQKVLAEGRIVGLANHTTLIARDGTERPIDDSAAPIRDDRGRILGVVLIFRDVTDQRRAQRRLRESEERYRTLVEASPQMVWALRPDWTMAFASRKWTEFTGKTAEQTRGAEEVALLFHPDDVPAFRATVGPAWARGEAHEVVARWRRHDGEYRWTSSRAVPVKDENGAVVMWIGTTADVHEQRLAAEELGRSREEYRLLVETNPALICRFRPDGTLTFVNDTYCAVFGKSREELVGSRFLPLVPPEDHPVVGRMLAALSPGMGPYVHEHRVVVAGGVRWQRWTNLHIAGRTADAEYQAVGVDVTDRRRAEEAAVESERRLRAILDAEPECVKLIDADGRLLEMNPAGLAMIEAESAGEVVGREMCDLVHPEHRAAFAELNRRVLAGETGWLEFRVTGLRGADRWLETHATPLRDRDGRVVAVLGVTRDVTGKKKLEERVEAAHHMLEMVLDHVPQGVFWKDQESRYLGCNSVVARAFGLAGPGAIVGLTDYDLPGLRPEQADFFIRKDREVVESGRAILGIEEPATLADGSVIWMETNKIPMRDSRGEIVGVLGTWQDVTDRKKLEDQLRQSQKMEAVGQLAGGVAHDFNNLLTVINGYADLLLTRVPSEEPMYHELEQVRNAGERAAGLTRQLLAFSRRTVVEPKVLDLNAVVWESETMLRRLIGEDVELVVRGAPGLHRIKADPGQVGQVLLNLALNARDAMPRGGKLTISTRNVGVDEASTARRPEVKPGDYAVLSVSDTGTGMAPEVLARIFEPFFTTKGVGRGTGLGLAVVHGIVQQSGGHIDVETESGRGTTFRLYFPVIEEEAGPLSRLIKRKTASPGTETVLFVEDEEGVRRVGELALRGHGYTVLSAAGPAEALRMFEDRRGGLALLVTDVVMPDMSGPQLADALRAKHPQMKVLFISGYTADAVLRHGILEGATNFLHKPFSPVALANKVREILDRE